MKLTMSFDVSNVTIAGQHSIAYDMDLDELAGRMAEHLQLLLRAEITDRPEVLKRPVEPDSGNPDELRDRAAPVYTKVEF